MSAAPFDNPPAGELTSLPADQELVLKVIPLPMDTNANGDIFGGWVMAQVDMAGAVLPSRIAGGRIPLTMELLSPARRPVQVTRDLASFWARASR